MPDVVFLLFTFTAFASAFLLFLIQPMFAKMLLPVLGGSPSVWTTCMLFFQVALLAGYGYAHVAPAMAGIRRHAVVHGTLVCMALLALPITLRSATAQPQGAIVAWVLGTSAVSVGLPFFALASCAPLLQTWYARTRHRCSRDPYVLYVASNAGSLAALLSYPAIIEPRLTLRSQADLWAVGYLVAAASTLVCAARVVMSTKIASVVLNETTAVTDERVTVARRLRWLELSFVPSSLLLGVTTFLSVDVAPVPLLWIVPLGVYLLSFVIVFSDMAGAAMARCRRALPFALLPEILLTATMTGVPLGVSIALHVATFGMLSILCHGALARDRPGAPRLTEFYLWLSLGGALGGVFNTILAPRLFSDVAEYPLAIVAASFLLASGRDVAALRDPRQWARPLLVVPIVIIAVLLRNHLALAPIWMAPVMAAIAVICFSMSRQPARFALSVGLVLFAGKLVSEQIWGEVQERSRTFFGVYRVTEDGNAREFRTLYHGTTVHGRQRIGESRPEPLSYYHRAGPIGELFSFRPREDIRSVGVIGLGVASLAAYAQPGQDWTFYEIDPEVERIARDSRWFRYLEMCGGTCSVEQGDGRLSLASSNRLYDVLVLDAFSSDAIPLHLLTTEAGHVYLAHLAQRGVLAFHISNRHLSLGAVAARLARDLELAAVGKGDAVPPGDTSGRASSVWVMMARQREDLEWLAGRTGWIALEPDDKPAWSDDFSSLWGVVRWGE